jgi:MOSC domain-containing protein YiiM
MKVVAISVGRPQEVQWRGRSVRTSIFKTPVSHRVHVTTGNIEGDQQSDLSVHGGPEKAVYAYPAEHYDFWRRELPDAELPWGAFGENLTTEGLLEDTCAHSTKKSRVGFRKLPNPVSLVVRKAMASRCPRIQGGTQRRRHFACP